MKNYAKKSLETSSGITLIALVITIIVLLILAGISISMLAGDNSILQKSTEAKRTTERAEAKEQAQMDIMSYIADKTANHQDASLSDEKIQEILSDNKSYVKTANATSFITTKGEYEIPYSELYTATGTTPTTSTATLPVGTYTVGQEVEFGGEKFFVIGDDGNSVRLLAKYCLTQDGTTQTDKDATNDGSNSSVIYGRPFLQTKYWEPYFTGTPLDLQTDAMIEEAEKDGTTIQNAVLTARAYGESKGVTGRLMTKDESDAIISSNSAIMYGNWTDGTQPTQGGLTWWLGYAPNISNVALIDYNNGGLTNVAGGFPFSGVRPVLIVSKS